MTRTRHESSVIAISWIPSEAIEGPSKIPFEQERGVRTATLRATTRARVAQASPDLLDRLQLEALAEAHRRENPAE